MNNKLARIKLSNIHSGTFFNLSYVSNITDLTRAGKATGHIILKRVFGTFRIGITTSHKKIAKQMIEAGTYSPTGKLKWGEFIPGTKNRFIRHTDKTGHYKEYALLHSSPNKIKAQYLVDGKPISASDLKETGWVRDSYWSRQNDLGCFTINLSNIESIGKGVNDMATPKKRTAKELYQTVLKENTPYDSAWCKKLKSLLNTPQLRLKWAKEVVGDFMLAGESAQLRTRAAKMLADWLAKF